MTEKRKYEKLSTRVIELKQQQALLTGSPLNGQLGDPEDYSIGDDPFSSAPQLPGGLNLFDF